MTATDELAHGALRGAIGAMGMTGLRRVTVDLGIVQESPPDAILRRRAPGLLGRVPRSHRRSAIELTHWAYGAGGGVAFALLPAEVRRRRWVGPLYGLAAWVAFEAGIAPALGLPHAKRSRKRESVGIALDHLLYGFALSEFRARPQEKPG